MENGLSDTVMQEGAKSFVAVSSFITPLLFFLFFCFGIEWHDGLPDFFGLTVSE